MSEPNHDELFNRVMENAMAQISYGCQQNYLNSCIAKGGTLAFVAEEVQNIIPVDESI